MQFMAEHIDRAELCAWMKRVMAETGWSAKAWADRAKTSPSNITRQLSRGDAALPTMRTLAKLAAQVPHLPPPFPGIQAATDHSFIPEVDARAGMGGGGLRLGELSVTDGDGNNLSADVIAGRWRLPDEYLARELKVRADAAWIIEVQGDSMAPMLQSGDRVMVDTAQKRPSPAGIFALWDGLGIVVKRLDYVAGSEPATVEVISDNTLHQRYRRTVEEAHIIGRVVWFARQL